VSRLTLRSRSPDETEQIGQRIATALRGGETIALIGQIGAGKTTWVRGLAAGLGCAVTPSSPTFVLQQWYRGRGGDTALLVCHIDCYRLDEPEEVARLGLFEPLDTRQVTVIEWADRAGAWLPPDRLSLTFQSDHGDTERTILAEQHGRGYEHLMAALEQAS
jgi:tRNA threonylcarbamoyladenosine biosynthesis protein TsaE